MTGSRSLLEICVDGPEGVAAALAGGADRIELCAALELGGLTPSIAAVARAVEGGLPVHAMVRPRAGDFRYGPAEASVMVAEVARLVDAGVAGVVVGALDDRGELDHNLIARLRSSARGILLTLHRAVDLVPDPVAAVGQAAALGCDLILTSGGATTAPQGTEMIARMVAAAPAGLAIVAGSGVRPDNVAALVRATGARQIHASAARSLPWPDGVVGFGFAVRERRVTDPDLVSQMRAALDAANASPN